MKTSIIMIILVSSVLFAQNGAGAGVAAGINESGIVSPGALGAGQGWSDGGNIGTGIENAQGEVSEPGKGWSTQKGDEKGNEDAKKESKE